MRVKVTKTIRVVKEYNDIENIEEAKKQIDLDIEEDQFTLLIAGYFMSASATAKRLD